MKDPATKCRYRQCAGCSDCCKGCYDHYRSCPSWTSSFGCKKTMRVNGERGPLSSFCRKSCKICKEAPAKPKAPAKPASTKDCSDRFSFCPTWTRTYGCKRTMRVNGQRGPLSSFCNKSCKVCKEADSSGGYGQNGYGD